MTDNKQYKETIENTYAKHAWVGQVIKTHMFPGDPGGELFRKTELQDKPYKVRVMSLFFEDEEKALKHGLTPHPHYLDLNLPCTIYVEG